MPSRLYAGYLFQNDLSPLSHSETAVFRILAYWFEWIDPPHAVMRFRPAAQHQLLQVADSCQVPVLHRAGGPLPRVSSVVLDRAPADRVPVQIAVMRPIHRRGV